MMRRHDIFALSLIASLIAPGCFFGTQDFEGSLAGPEGCVTGFVERDGRCYREAITTPPARDMCAGDACTARDMSPPLDMGGEDMAPDVDMRAGEDMAPVDMDPPPELCRNGELDPGEQAVDCGGMCAACPTCSDGILNQDEAQIDCGGVCSACPTCADGLQNQDEEGVDCGGSDCDACETCDDGVKNQDEEQTDCGGVCAACPTCSDGIANQDEEGVDCGGSVCAACMTSFPRVTFTMGASSGNPDAFPTHSVTLSPFAIDETEVTVSDYTRCVTAGACTEPATRFDGCNYNEPGRGAHPVHCVSWTQADAFCAWVGKRLPTEAEWEFSAVGRTNRTHPWGNQAADCTRAILAEFNGNPVGCGAGTTAPVGSLPAGDTPEGVSDLLGNASEWVSDWYDASYYQNSPSMDPQGPATGTKRVYRGHDYKSNLNGIDVRRRFSRDPDSEGARVGFRCARTE